MKQKKNNSGRSMGARESSDKLADAMTDSGDKGAETELTTDILAFLESATSREEAEEAWAFLESLENHTYKP
jgi:hypothetical protein